MIILLNIFMILVSIAMNVGFFFQMNDYPEKSWIYLLLIFGFNYIIIGALFEIVPIIRKYFINFKNDGW